MHFSYDRASTYPGPGPVPRINGQRGKLPGGSSAFMGHIQMGRPIAMFLFFASPLLRLLRSTPLCDEHKFRPPPCKMSIRKFTRSFLQPTEYVPHPTPSPTAGSILLAGVADLHVLART